MKAASFEYRRPGCLAEAVALLREYGEDAKLLAGGQTLLASLAMRLSEPVLLIDIGSLAELKGITITGTHLRIGALTRHVEIERSELIARHLPLLSMAAPHVAHAAIRNRGTFGGSIAFADPAAEWPACVLAADGEVILSDGQAARRVMAKDFFINLYQTGLRRDEVLTAVEFPLPPSDRKFAFAELARRHGDYALAGIAMGGKKSEGLIDDLRIVCFGIGTVPVRATKAEAALNGRPGSGEAIQAALDQLKEELSPIGDLSTSAESKLHLAGVLLRRSLAALFSEDQRA